MEFARHMSSHGHAHTARVWKNQRKNSTKRVRFAFSQGLLYVALRRPRVLAVRPLVQNFAFDRAGPSALTRFTDCTQKLDPHPTRDSSRTPLIAVVHSASLSLSLSGTSMCSSPSSTSSLSCAWPLSTLISIHTPPRALFPIQSLLPSLSPSLQPLACHLPSSFLLRNVEWVRATTPRQLSPCH